MFWNETVLRQYLRSLETTFMPAMFDSTEQSQKKTVFDVKRVPACKKKLSTELEFLLA